MDTGAGQKGGFHSRPSNRAWSVPGAIQFFRRECFELLGGFLPLPYGGLDTHATVTAQKGGWAVRAFPDLPVHHRRASGSVGVSRTRALVREGRRDFSLGYHPLYEVAKSLRRLGDQPFILGSGCMLLGFVRESIAERNRMVPNDFVAYLRRQQLRRLLAVALLKP